MLIADAETAILGAGRMIEVRSPSERESNGQDTSARHATVLTR
jgi:hypothetical protein